MSTRVSIVIPTFNSARFVAATLDSALAQTFDDFELIVADHGSVDDTWEIVERYAAKDPRVRLLHTEPGGGAARNWNRVTAAAAGEFLKLLPADDLLYPYCLAEQVAALDRYPTAVLCAARRDIVDAAGGVLFRARGLPGLSGLVEGPVAIRATVLAGTNVFGEPGSVLMRTSALRASGPWSDVLPYVIDQDMYVRVLRRGDLVAIPQPLGAFRLSSTQWSAELAREQAAQARSFHREVRAADRSVISAADEALGSARATAIAWGRRLVYLRWRSRLQLEVKSESTATLASRGRKRS